MTTIVYLIVNFIYLIIRTVLIILFIPVAIVKVPCLLWILAHHRNRLTFVSIWWYDRVTDSLLYILGVKFRRWIDSNSDFCTIE